MWVWSVEPAHEPLIPKWMYDELNAKSWGRKRSRDGAALKNDAKATRTCLFRRRVVCDCGRSMTGNPRRGVTYYRCHPANNNRGRPDKYEGHPATVYMREDLIMNVVNQFFAERVFGPKRRGLFAASLDNLDTAATQERFEQRERAQRQLADIARKQDNVLRQVEDGDPDDPFTQRLRQRFNDLEAQRKTQLALVADLDKADAGNAARPSAEQVNLLDALPHLAVNLHRAPSDILDRLFDLTQLTVRVHYATNEATVKVTLPAGEADSVIELSKAIEEEQMPNTTIANDGSAGRGECASCTCPRCDSNAHWTGFESVASADWATGARAMTLRDASRAPARGPAE